MLTKKQIAGLIALGFILWIVITRDTEVLGLVNADAATVGAGGGQTPVQQLNQHAINLSMLISYAEFLAYLAFWILAFLLEPELITGTLMGADTTLNTIWQLSRDLMNILFALMIVVGAVMTVVTAKPDYVKSYAVKFVLSVILVNFSWFFPRVILDVANVTAATIWSLPDHIGMNCQVQQAGGGFQPCRYIRDIKFLDAAQAATGCEKRIGGNVCIVWDTFPGNTTNTAFGIINGLVVNFGRLGELSRVASSSSTIGGGAVTPNVNLNRVSDFIFFLIYAATVLLFTLALTFPLICMVVLFIVRIPIIWLTIAFMPFMFLGVLIGDKMGEFNTKSLIFTPFVAAAFLPAAVAVPFAIGFIMIQANHSAPPDVMLNALSATPSPIRTLTMASLWDFLWLIITFFVIWKGFFMATQIHPAFKAIGDKFKGVGESWGKFALKAPLAIPAFPIPGSPSGQTMTPLQALGFASNPESLLSNGRIRNFQDSMSQTGTASVRAAVQNAAGDAARAGQLRQHVTDISTGQNMVAAVNGLKTLLGQELRTDTDIKGLLEGIRNANIPLSNRDDFDRNIRRHQGIS